MNKSLLFSLSLLTSMPAFSMQDSSKQLLIKKTDEIDINNINEMQKQFTGFISELNGVLKEEKNLDPETILTPFNEQTIRIKSHMQPCLVICKQI